MVSILSLRYRSVSRMAMFLLLSTTPSIVLSKMERHVSLSEIELQELQANYNESYLYCGKDHSKMADLMAAVLEFDADENSAAWNLHRHITSGLNIGREDAIIEALMHVEKVMNKVVNNEKVEQIASAFEAVMNQVLDGSLVVRLAESDEEEMGMDDNQFGEEDRTPILKIREKLYALDRAKFFEEVEFKDEVQFNDDVAINGMLSVSEEIIACDLTVGCNINMVNSVDAAHGNILKNGIIFLSNPGTNNTFVGANSGNPLDTGANNVGIGANALSSNLVGNFSVAVGSGAMQTQTNGFNVGVGYNALRNNTTAQFNTAIGWSSLAANTTGEFNTAVGDNSMGSNITGAQNVAIGVNALSSNVVGNQCTAVGLGAMQNQIVGANVAVGYNALNSNVTAQFSTAVGWSALANATAAGNTAIGNNTLSGCTTGTINTVLGNHAGAGITTGSNNIFVGSNAGNTVATGSNNIHIGAGGLTAAEANTIRIGTLGTQAACFVQGISGVTTGLAGTAVLVDANGQLGTISSRRAVKRDIEPLGEVSAKILDLDPVSFVYRDDAANRIQYGLIADDVDQILPEIVVHDEEGAPVTVQYHLLPVLLLDQMKKQHAEFLALVERVADLEARA